MIVAHFYVATATVPDLNPALGFQLSYEVAHIFFHGKLSQ